MKFTYYNISCVNASDQLSVGSRLQLKISREMMQISSFPTITIPYLPSTLTTIELDKLRCQLGV
ncbi:CLUMA_CG012447, isoform A [Clunio marinus]|uniref:CLUMA_CG012447, isoform A n=1 Tax=Clunio marinus TaxID=568069 RepID=A0A1J1IJ46_9DIPT|nr:CLUMA_CG012447, isoform A [Clunio marinus]